MPDRRDKKGRVLRQGESQRSDGMYMFRYTDPAGKRRTVYSWRLTATDKTPTGKKEAKSLREQEKDIAKDLEDDIDLDGSAMTVDQLFDRFMDMRKNLRATTRKNYLILYDAMVRERIGGRPLKTIRNSDLKRLYVALATKDHYAKNSILKVHSILFQMFRQAEIDRLVRYNPAMGAFDVIDHSDLCPEPVKRKALTKQQQSVLIDYVYQEPSLQHYANLLTVLLGTGMRVGECVGLRICDCDFDTNLISVNHTLTYKNTEDKGYHYMVAKPKTPSGFRSIPMFPEVRTALLREIACTQHKQTNTYSVDGYHDFIFLTTKGTPMRPSFIHEVLQRTQAQYNAQEKAAATLEHRDPIYLPHLTPHILRHTFCTRLCECESNIKVVQDVMGHKRSSTTMDIYNDAMEEEKVLNFANLEGKIKLA